MNETGRGMQGVRLELKNEKRIANTISGSTGGYSFNNVIPGSYILTCSKEQYTKVSYNIILGAGADTTVNLTITPQTPDIIVTGTGYEKKLENSTIPVSLIPKQEIENSGYSRLSDILQEQPGINLTSFLGTGAQLQGLDPDYTLILIDGEPLTGRNGGTIDLSRVTTGNIKQVEIIKGPSSSLYGSEALAGVINIITSDSYYEGVKTALNTKFGTFNTADLSSNTSLRNKSLSVNLFLNRYSSSGYDLTPQSITHTSPGFYNYTINPVIKYQPDDKTTLKFSGRAYLERQDFITIVSGSTSDYIIDDRESLNDYNVTLSLAKKLGESTNLNTSVYASDYEYNSILTYQEDGSPYFEDKFRQRYYKGEADLKTLLPYNNILSTGAGAIFENVTADRIYGGKRSTSNYFGFIQDEWMPLPEFTLIAGTRFDSHSDYASRFSPKVSALYKPFVWASIRGSVGGGFKAPTFQQLYLDFSNPQVGYSVFGTFGFAESFQRLLTAGEIETIYIEPSSISTIKPENSTAYNAGLTLKPFDFISAEVNFFRNDVNDLIEVLPVAKKTNGQNVFTYFNLNRVYTQGIESRVDVTLPAGFSLTVGYQYLDAKDKKVIDDIEAKKIFKTGSTGVVRPVQAVEYGGLFNRPKHSGIVKLNYDNKVTGLNANIRAIIKGKYGYADFNSNQILDNANEYIAGYVLWNAAVSQKIGALFTVRAGIENIFDRVNPGLLPEIPGRIIFGEIGFTY